MIRYRHAMRNGWVLLLALIGGCGGPAVSLRLIAGADAVEVSTVPPGDGYAPLGPVTGTHGDGCGDFGHRGEYEDALVALRNAAVERGATYVTIVSVLEPHQNGTCLDQRFVIRGLAYRGAQGR
jgi:hypothetical protein